MDEVYGSLEYDGAPLLRVHLCVSRALLVLISYSELFFDIFCSASNTVRRNYVVNISMSRP